VLIPGEIVIQLDKGVS